MSEEELLAAWSRLRDGKGRRSTVLDLYRLAAEPRGLAPHELPLEERLRLARAVMPLIWPGFGVSEGSERRDPTVVVDYDPIWPERFESWRLRIADALGEAARRIEHVGSTSVPGLAAKPIVDIQVSVGELAREELYVEQLAGVGLQLRTRDDLHRYFRPFAGSPRDVHVHVCASGSAWEREHLLFRDHLRTHPDACAVYAQAKKEALRLWSDDRWGYTDAKGGVILDILEAAEAWATTADWRP